ncbi:hypothetical protein EMCRGX_G013839 [Ephydatia muelleri]
MNEKFQHRSHQWIRYKEREEAVRSNSSSKQASTIMKIIESRDTCRMLLEGAARGPDDNSHGVSEVKGSVIYLVVATLEEVDHFPSSTSIREKCHQSSTICLSLLFIPQPPICSSVQLLHHKLSSSKELE